MNLHDGISSMERGVVSVLMIGQSNMAGRGAIGDVEPIRNPDCLMLRMGRWQPMSEPVNPDRSVFGGTFCSGVSLATSFADELAKQLRQPVGLIPCADGGTRLSQWMPGEVLFDHAVMMAQLAMRTSRLGGIIWHQGESDCGGDIEAYRYDLITMLRELRRQLHAEDLPLVLGELSLQADRKQWRLGDWPERVNAILPGVARELSRCAVASADGLTLKADGIHFDSPSCRVFGKRYCEKFIALYSGAHDKANATEV